MQRCDICQHVNRKLETIAPALNPVPVKAPWYHLGVDFVGPIAYQSPAGMYTVKACNGSVKINGEICGKHIITNLINE